MKFDEKINFLGAKFSLCCIFNEIDQPNWYIIVKGRIELYKSKSVDALCFHKRNEHALYKSE